MDEEEDYSILLYENDEKLIIIRIFLCLKRKVIGGDEDCERNPMMLPESNRIKVPMEDQEDNWAKEKVFQSIAINNSLF